MSEILPNKMEPYTTIKQAIKNWEKKHKKDDIRFVIVLNFSRQWFPILNMDNDLKKLRFCEGLIMDSNKIEKFAGLGQLQHLSYLSMELNQIKSLKGLEPLKYTLQVLLLGCNLLKTLKGVEKFIYLEILHIPNNMISNWTEFDRILMCDRLTNISMIGNKFNATLPMDVWVFLASRRNPRLRIIENSYITEKFPKGYHPRTIIEPSPPTPQDKKPSEMEIKFSKKKLPKASENSFDYYPSSLTQEESYLTIDSSEQWEDYF